VVSILMAHPGLASTLPGGRSAAAIGASILEVTPSPLLEFGNADKYHKLPTFISEERPSSRPRVWEQVPCCTRTHLSRADNMLPAGEERGGVPIYNGLTFSVQCQAVRTLPDANLWCVPSWPPLQTPWHTPMQADTAWLQRITAAWQQGELSNLDYLLYLNLVSRSFHDLTQYPVRLLVYKQEFIWALQKFRRVPHRQSPVIFDGQFPIGVECRGWQEGF